MIYNERLKSLECASQNLLLIKNEMLNNDMAYFDKNFFVAYSYEFRQYELHSLERTISNKTYRCFLDQQYDHCKFISVIQNSVKYAGLQTLLNAGLYEQEAVKKYRKTKKEQASRDNTMRNYLQYYGHLDRQ